MGLLRKRWQQKVAEATAAANSNLNQKTGLDIQLTVDDSSFPEDEKVMDDFFMHEIYGLTAVTDALAAVTRDALGKEAVQEQIKTVTLCNTATAFEDKGTKSVSLKKGVLTVNCAFSEGSENLCRADALAKELERLL